MSDRVMDYSFSRSSILRLWAAYWGFAGLRKVGVASESFSICLIRGVCICNRCFRNKYPLLQVLQRIVNVTSLSPCIDLKMEARGLFLIQVVRLNALLAVCMGASIMTFADVRGVCCLALELRFELVRFHRVLENWEISACIAILRFVRCANRV